MAERASDKARATPSSSTTAPTGAARRVEPASNSERLASLDLEHEADAFAGRMATRASGSPIVPTNDGAVLAPPWRSAFEGELGRDLSAVRITGGPVAGTIASTRGNEIAIDPLAAASPRVVAHEVAHVAQQADGVAPLGRAQGWPDFSEWFAEEVSTGEPLEIPQSMTEKTSGVVVARSGDQVAILPAGPHLVIVKEATERRVRNRAPMPLVTLPTIGKESMVAVRVGGRLGFMVDVGGTRAVITPDALQIINHTLGITRISDVVLTHAHRDHLRSAVEVIAANDIPPERVHFPEGFENVAEFRDMLRKLARDPRTSAIGHAANAAYHRIPTQGVPGAQFWRFTHRTGGMTFEYVGLTEPISDLRTKPRASDKNVDAASPMIRVTHEATGASFLYLSDLRGRNLTKFREAMGEEEYDRFVRNVRAIIGFQHHLGALGQSDVAGLSNLIVRTHTRGTGDLKVVVQSAERYGGKQFVNRAVGTALQQIGVEVVIAHGPNGGNAGTVTLDASGNVRIRGGVVETLAPDAIARGEMTRLARLGLVEDTLTKYEQFVTQPHRRSADVRAAREAVEAEFRSYVPSTLGNIVTEGPGAEVARRAGTLKDPAAQQAALQRVRTPHAIEAMFTPEYMETITELRRLGPHYETWTKAVADARATNGRISEAGIDALWELNYKAAERLISGSGLTKRQQRQAMAQHPNAPAPVPRRLMAGFLMGIEVVNLAAPFVEQYRRGAYEGDVGTFLGIIMWWQSKGVFPKIQGVNDRWWPRSNVWTHEPDEVQSMLNSGDLDFLAMNEISDEMWDPFMVWASANLLTLLDFERLVFNSPAVRIGDDGTWEYRAGEVEGTTTGHDVNSRWVKNDRLDQILQGSLAAVIAETQVQLDIRGNSPGPHYASADAAHDAASPRSAGVLARFPAASGKWRFKQDIAEPKLYALREPGGRNDREYLSMAKNSLLYSFPEEVIEDAAGDVPDEFLVVSGADFATYNEVVNSPNRVHTINIAINTGQPFKTPHSKVDQNWDYEVLLARKDDLEPVP